MKIYNLSIVFGILIVLETFIETSDHLINSVVNLFLGNLCACFYNCFFVVFEGSVWFAALVYTCCYFAPHIIDDIQIRRLLSPEELSGNPARIPKQQLLRPQLKLLDFWTAKLVAELPLMSATSFDIRPAHQSRNAAHRKRPYSPRDLYLRGNF
ncbi:MAG: hypothetical protein EZS28_018061 [Streblomastix strix]|uniref:Uncharacterized protein n=1 Tax=Streblomastix strix TaxID=222440 RepID=A0A5J4VUM6_9EUKA|nr:MAG: hypothetical protein EZS28_018061 [Streblomastix strix]